MIKIIQTVALSAILARAVYTDVRTGRIENRWMLAGMAAGIAFAYGCGGTDGLFCAFRAAGVTFGVLYVLYLIRGLGAGDVKLISVMAFYLPGEMVSLVAGAFVAGGCLAILKMSVRRMRGGKAYLRGETIPFAVPTAISCLCILTRGAFQ